MNEKNLSNASKADKKVPLINSEFWREKEYPEILTLSCQNQQLTATLSDGRIISIPTVWHVLYSKIKAVSLELSNLGTKMWS